jgi:hypothetical protein
MKKLVMVIALAAIFATGSVFAVQDGFGIGVIGGFGGGWGSEGSVAGGGALSLKFPSVPVYWGINLDIWSSGMWLGVSGDFIHLIDNQPLVKEIGLSWFIRGGLYGKVFIGQNIFGLDFGARLPIGLSWQPIKLIELFIDVAPSIGLGITFADPVRLGLGGGWGGELGIRLWF